MYEVHQRVFSFYTSIGSVQSVKWNGKDNFGKSVWVKWNCCNTSHIQDKISACTNTFAPTTDYERHVKPSWFCCQQYLLAAFCYLIKEKNSTKYSPQWGKQGIDQQIFNSKSISRKITHLQSLFK